MEFIDYNLCRFGYIYLTKNNINGKMYIGKRIYKNENEDKKYYGSGFLIKKALKKYGKNNFTKEILCCCENKDELNEKEIYYIEMFDAFNDKNFYNLTKGGEGSTGVSRFGENNPFFGKHHTKETIEIIRNIHKGKKLNEHHKNILTNSQKGKPKSKEWIESVSGKNSYWFGKHLSEETKHKLSLSKIGKTSKNKGKSLWNEDDKKRIRQKSIETCTTRKSVICIETGIVYESIIDAGRKTNIHHQSINACCKNKRKSAGSYRWKYYEK